MNDLVYAVLVAWMYVMGAWMCFVHTQDPRDPIEAKLITLGMAALWPLSASIATVIEAVEIMRRRRT